MKNNYLDEFVKSCLDDIPERGDEKFLDWDTLMTILVYEGLIRLSLPLLKDWLKLGVAGADLMRQKIKKRLIDYAHEKELDFPQAEKAAEAIVNKISEKNIEKIIKS
jgi:hypothetical protein